MQKAPFSTVGVLAAALTLSACADLSPTAQRTGAGVGAAGGLAWDQHVQSRDRAFNQGVAAGRASVR